MASWSSEPLDLAVALLAVVAAAGSWRGAPALRRSALALAVVAVVAAVVWPLARMGERHALSAHLAQHVVLWDLAPIALLAGTGRLPAGVPRRLANPAVALPLWIVSLAFWHVPPVFDATLRHGLLHGLAHAELLAVGILMWAPVLGVVSVPAWFGVGASFAYVAVMQLAGLVFGNLLLWWASPLYAALPEPYGSFSPLTDQRLAGGIVLLEGSAVAIAAFALLFLRLVRADDDGHRADSVR